MCWQEKHLYRRLSLQQSKILHKGNKMKVTEDKARYMDIFQEMLNEMDNEEIKSFLVRLANKELVSSTVDYTRRKKIEMLLKEKTKRGI